MTTQTVEPFDPLALDALISQAPGRGESAATHIANAAFGAMLDGGKYEAAERALRGALQLEPDNVTALNNLATTVKTLGREAEAIALYRRVLEINPKYHKAHMNLAVSLLRNGQFAEGWSSFEHRFRARPAARQIPHPTRPGYWLWETRVASVKDVREHSGVVLGREQGIGDELFYLRFVPRLRWQAGRLLRPVRVYYDPSPKLRPVLEAAGMGVDMGMAPGALPVIPLASLPHVTGMATVRHIPRAVNLRRALRRTPRLNIALYPRPLIGLTWRSGILGSRHLGGLDKQIPLDVLGRALRGLRGTLVAVQDDATDDELQRLQDAAGARAWRVCFYDDLKWQLALLEALDEYIGVSSTNMHLRAGLKRRARVLVPFPAEFRWMASDDRSPWFPRFDVYRQAVDGDWDAALTRLRNDL